MNAQATAIDKKTRLEHHWPEPLTAKQLDAKYPGILDSTVFLSAGANIIMQLSLPAVGHGVAESRVTSGSVLHNPLKRTRTTFTYLAVAMMGTSEEKLAYRKAVNGAHKYVHSTDESPVKYNAFDPELQLWVAACLYWGFVDTYQKVHRPLTRAEQEEFYQLAHPLGTTLQVRQEMWPKDLDAFEEYWQNGLDNLHIDARVHEFLMIIVDLKFLSPITQKLFGKFNRFVTSGFLPPEIREAMNLEWNADKQRKFDKTVRFFGKTMKFLPRPVRQAAYLLPLRDFRKRMASGKPMI